MIRLPRIWGCRTPPPPAPMANVHSCDHGGEGRKYVGYLRRLARPTDDGGHGSGDDTWVPDAAVGVGDGGWSRLRAAGAGAAAPRIGPSRTGRLGAGLG